MRRTISILILGAVAGMTIPGALLWTPSDRGSETPPRPTRTDVRLERSSSVVPQVRLQSSTPFSSASNDSGRNPFSFRPVRAVASVPGRLTDSPAARVSLLEPQRIPPAVEVPFKFMGTLQKVSGDTWAIFADCAGYTRAARAGESVLGAWTVVRVGAKFAVVESLAGQPVTMALAGCGARQN